MNEPDVYLNSPLHHASLAGFTEVMKCLCELGADVNAKNAQGRSCLQFAAQNGAPDVTDILLKVS